MHLDFFSDRKLQNVFLGVKKSNSEEKNQYFSNLFNKTNLFENNTDNLYEKYETKFKFWKNLASVDRWLKNYDVDDKSLITK